jgi:ATP-dependent protease ClpP protease subunit
MSGRPFTIIAICLALGACGVPSSGPSPPEFGTASIDAAGVVHIDGFITDAVADHLELLIALTGGKKLIIGLDSQGGYVRSGERIIDDIVAVERTGRVVVTWVPPHGRCHSMCIAIFIRGERRIAAADSTWVIHNASFPITGATDRRSTAQIVEQIGQVTDENWLLRKRWAASDVGEKFQYGYHSAAELMADMPGIIDNVSDTAW